MAGKRAKTAKEFADHMKTGVAEVKTGVAEVKTLADGRLSSVISDLAVANEKIAGLERMMKSNVDALYNARKINDAIILAGNDLHREP